MAQEKNKPQKQEVFYQPELAAVGEDTSFIEYPTSSASNLFEEVLIGGEDINSLPARKKQINNGTKIEVLEKEGRRKVEYYSKGKGQFEKISLEIDDISHFTGSNKPAKKLYVVSLVEVNRQAFHNGELTRDYISFPLQELVDKGLYSTRQSARKGFLSGAEALGRISLGGTLVTRKTRHEIVNLRPFRHAEIINNQCVVHLEKDFNWGMLLEFYTIVPNYCYRLPNRAFDLLIYIFQLARQRTKNIKEKGYFTISFRAIQHRLWLPSEENNAHPKQTIKDPIEEAITRIEQEQEQQENKGGFMITPIYSESSSIKEFLDDGYLKIELSGDFAATFIQIAQKTLNKIEAAKKRNEKRVDAIIVARAAQSAKEDMDEGKKGEA